jgi:hypothetical protein
MQKRENIPHEAIRQTILRIFTSVLQQMEIQFLLH